MKARHDKIEKQVIECLSNPKTIFDIISHLPPLLLFFIAPALCHIIPPNFTPPWIVNPESDFEILLTSLIAKDINKIDPLKLDKAIKSIAEQHSHDEKVHACLAGLRVTLIAIDTNLDKVEKWERIRNSCQSDIFVNLTGAKLQGADLHGANFEHTLFVPSVDLTREANKEPESRTNLQNADLRDAKLPIFMTRINLNGTQLKGTNILQTEDLQAADIANSSFFDELTSLDIQQELDLINHDIEQLKQIHEFRHAIARSFLARISLMADKAEAEKVFNIALDHPIFEHTSQISSSINKTGRFFTHQIFYPTKSQSILLEYKNRLENATKRDSESSVRARP